MTRAVKDVGRWGSREIGPGERGRVRVVVSETYAGADIGIPVYVWRGAAPGPTVFVTGAVHGDEINGTGIIRSIIVDKPFELER
ncbi:MAG: hypothetical protein KDB15_17230, partial [Microthrixaceae bacterium]|nr:hypothetical protein [Microthrixaceae bacterium]